MKQASEPTDRQEQNRKRNGMLTSVLVHGLFLLIMLGFTMEAPYPPPLEQGIAIQFGGEIESGGESDQNQQNLEESKQDQAQPVAVESTDPSQKAADKKLATQNQEDAPTIPSDQKASKKPKESTPVDPKGLFPGSRSGANKGPGGASGRKGNPDGRPQGGEQGDPRNTDRDTLDHSLQGRNLMSSDKPEDETQLRGVVVINVSVNLQGQVMQAELNTRKSTISRPDIVEKCKSSARKCKFSVADKQKSPPIQTGSITFRFELN